MFDSPRGAPTISGVGPGASMFPAGLIAGRALVRSQAGPGGRSGIGGTSHGSSHGTVSMTFGWNP